MTRPIYRLVFFFLTFREIASGGGKNPFLLDLFIPFLCPFPVKFLRGTHHLLSSSRLPTQDASQRIINTELPGGNPVFLFQSLSISRGRCCSKSYFGGKKTNYWSVHHPPCMEKPDVQRIINTTKFVTGWQL